MKTEDLCKALWKPPLRKPGNIHTYIWIFLREFEHKKSVWMDSGSPRGCELLNEKFIARYRISPYELLVREKPDVSSDNIDYGHYSQMPIITGW